jgi:two-component system response regulator PilR (NtrC family)
MADLNVKSLLRKKLKQSLLQPSRTIFKIETALASVGLPPQILECLEEELEHKHSPLDAALLRLISAHIHSRAALYDVAIGEAMLIARDESMPKDLRAFAHAVICDNMARKSEHASATAHAKIALGLVEAAETEEFIYILASVASVYFNQSKYNLALEYYETCLSISRKMAGSVNSPVIYTNVAMAKAYLGKEEEAIQMLREYLEKAEKPNSGFPISPASLFMGGVLNNLERYSEAVPFLQRATALFTKVAQFGKIVECKSELARAYFGSGDFAKALAAASEALRDAEEHGQVRIMPFCQLLVGMAHAKMKKRALAAKFFEKSVSEYQKRTDPADQTGMETALLEFGKFLADSDPKRAQALLVGAIRFARTLTLTRDVERVIHDAETTLSNLGFGVILVENSAAAVEEKRTSKLMSILSEVNAGGSFAETLGRLSDGLLEISSAERALVATTDGESILVVFCKNFSGDPKDDPSWRAIQIILERTLASGRRIAVSNTIKSELLGEIPGVPRAVFSFPLRADGKTTGCIYLDSRFIVLEMEEEAGGILDTLVEQAAAAVHKAALIEEIRALNAQLENKIVRRERELETAKKEIEIRDRVLAERHAYANIIGKSPALVKLFDLLDKVRESDLPVTITGESGTGKELIAQAIHYNSSRAKSPFVALNCAAMPDALLESELFGHEKGAFTGAVVKKIGLLESAGRGTVFLDEITDMNPAMQAKLLRVIEEGEVRPVGSTRQIKVSSRIITAGARNLEELVKSGQFREDLFYRLNVLSIRIPPLRERREDIPLLVAHFWKKASGSPMPSEGRAAILKILSNYDWPGNVRELENEVNRLYLFGGGKLDPTCLSPNVLKNTGQGVGGFVQPTAGAFPLAAIERKCLLEALRAAKGKKSEAARILGIPRTSIKYKMDRHGITMQEIFSK